MESQIQQAVDIANEPSSDPILKEQALTFINQIKSTDEGWQSCLKLLQLDTSSTNVKFFALQVINVRLPYLSNNDKINLKNVIFSYLKNLIATNTVDPFFLRNALSKTLALVFVYSTLNCYTTLIKDLLSLAYDPSSNVFNDIATDYYLRTLLVIHQEIGDQLITRDNNSQELNNNLKDAIRANDMLDMTNTWKKFLVYYTSNNTQNKDLANENINNTISCIGSYVSWIEINLILEDQYMNFLYEFLTSNDNSRRRILTANTFNEILHKKMPPVKKLELINFLNLGSMLNQLNLNCKIMNFDVSMALSKLINQIGIEIIILLENSSEQDLLNNEFRNLASSKILEIFPLIFEFLSSEFDDISLEVFPFIGNFLLFLKKNIVNENIDFSSLNNNELLSTLMKNIILKLKFDEEDDGDDDDTIEQFNEIRSKLKVFIDSIVLLNETLALDVIMSCINEFLFSKINSNENLDWRTIDLGLYVLTYYSDMLRNNVMNLPKTMINNSRPYFVFNEMLCKVITNSEQILVNHPLIQLSFFELLSKHYTFFNNNNIQVENINKEDILMKVFNIFISNFGVFSSNDKVKYRSWYLFYRFIKMTKPKINDFVIEELIKSLVSLLVFNFEIISNKNKSSITNISTSSATSSSSDSKEFESLYNLDLTLIEETGSFESQLYLFESVGLLIILISDESLKVTILENVLQPLFTNLENGISSISSLTLNLNLLIQVHHSLIAMGNILKGFENLPINLINSNLKILNIFNQISQVVLITLENFIYFNIIRESCQFCIVRLYIILSKSNNELLQTILSKFISCIMINFDKLSTLEIINFINFISQILHNASDKENLYLLLESLISPFFNKIFTRIENNKNISNDEFSKRENLDLQKSTLSLIISISNDHLNSLWISSDINKEMLINIIKMMLEYASDYNNQDLTIIKLSLLVLNMLCQGLGTSGVIDPLDLFKNDSKKFDQVDEILVNNCILLATEIGLKIPVSNKSLLKDAQFRNNIILEVSRLLKAIVHIGYEYPDANTLQKKTGLTNNINNNNNNNNSNNSNSNNSDSNNNENNDTNNNNSKLLPGFNEVKCQQISNVLINNLGFPVDLANQFVQTLISSPDRQFMKYLVDMINKF